MKLSSSKEYILGIAASSRVVRGVLVHNGPDGPVIVREFSEARGLEDHFGVSLPDLEGSVDSDVSFNVGGQEEDSDSGLFLAGEFGAQESGTESSGMTASASVVTPFDLELLDIISDCRDAGYENFRLVFAIGTEFLTTSEIELSNDSKGGRRRSSERSSATAKQADFLAVLKKSHGKKVESENVALIPMQHGDGAPDKSLAVLPSKLEPVTPTLQSIRDRKRPIPTVDLMDSEITLLLGLAQTASLLGAISVEDVDAENESAGEKPVGSQSIPDEDHKVLLVRAGAQDTIVMFLSGGTLVRYEDLRSITTFDPSETICSRVLLLQDEFGLPDPDTVVLLADDQENALLESFQIFFPDSRVSSLRSYLPRRADTAGEALSYESILASAVTLRLIDDELYRAVFQDVNFLPRNLLRRSIQLPFSWPIAAMYTLLFCSSLYFVYRFYAQQHELELFRYELRQYPEDVVDENSQVLQARIDSLQMLTEGYVRSLDVLDSLLIGSDRWSRSLEKTADVSAEVGGIWIEQWQEDDEEDYLLLKGNATDRDDVVAFAAQADAIIESLTFSEIRGWPVFSFTMKMRMSDELPEAARYFREHVRDTSPTL